MSSTFLSRFTPSLNDPETLEAIFVQREQLAQRRLQDIRESALTPAKHYSLITGPRGIGKTHLIAVLYHRVKEEENLQGRLCIAWLPEEEWGAASFLDLMVKMLNALSREYSDQELAASVEALYDSSPGTALQQASRLLIDYVGERTLLVFIENLDQLFSQLGLEGQKRLRAYIQENAFFTVLATAQNLTGPFTLQRSPFYGFFAAYPLGEFGYDESLELLQRIAERQNDQELVRFVESPVGHARVRALRHLAGGNPRILVVFSQFLSRETFDQLVDPFMEMLDDLTPYYQDRLRTLSPQQRKIVEFLCEHAAPATVKGIARRCFITSQTASGQLRELRQKGYVHSIEVGRESYYELREPLMRLVFEVKKSRGEPIRLFVDFLRIWHTKMELHDQLLALPEIAVTEREYLRRAIQEIETNRDPGVAACERDYRAAREVGDFSCALPIAKDLVAVRGTPNDYLELADCHVNVSQYAEALDVALKVIESDPGEHWACALRALALSGLDRTEEAFAAAAEATRLAPECVQSWMIRVNLQGQSGDAAGALALVEEALSRIPQNPGLLGMRGYALLELAEFQAARVAYTEALNANREDGRLWNDYGAVLFRIGDYNAAEAALDRAFALLGPSASLLWNRGVLLEKIGGYERALEAYQEAIKLGSQSPCAFFNRASCLFSLGRNSAGLTALTEVLARFNPTITHATGHTVPILATLLQRGLHVRTLTKLVSRLVALYDAHGVLPALGQALVRNVPLMVNAISDKASETWVRVWAEQGAGRDALQVGIRLVATAQRWQLQRDPRVLLALPSEERALLEGVLAGSAMGEHEPANAIPRQERFDSS